MAVVASREILSRMQGGTLGIEIREVVTARDLKKFIRFPFQIYQDHPFWVPGLDFDEANTLRRDKNPAFEYCDSRYWLAYRDGAPVGRIAGIINRRYIEKWKNRYARFGWIDFVDDENVCRALLQTVENWARQNGLTAVHGPLGFTDLDREGMLVEGFQELGTLATIYNHPYYPKHLEACGYRKDIDWVEFLMKTPAVVPEKALRVAEIAGKRYKLRLLELKKPKDILKYAKGVFAVLDAAYEGLYGVVPLTDRQVNAYIKQYFGFVNPEYIKIVVDAKDQVAGFLIALPSLSRALQKSAGKLVPFGFIHLYRAIKRNQFLDLYIAAVRPDLQGKGVNAIFMAEITKTAIKNGITFTETNPELETNLKVQSHWDYFEGRQHKRRRCYLKAL
jgi:GNAT superfamily N-acetyltransferase